MTKTDTYISVLFAKGDFGGVIKKWDALTKHDSTAIRSLSIEACEAICLSFIELGQIKAAERFVRSFEQQKNDDELSKFDICKFSLLMYQKDFFKAYKLYKQSPSVVLSESELSTLESKIYLKYFSNTVVPVFSLLFIAFIIIGHYKVLDFGILYIPLLLVGLLGLTFVVFFNEFTQRVFSKLMSLMFGKMQP